MKRGSSGLSFLLGIDKAPNMSSHDVVNRIRGIYQEKRVGHTGTLDPLASGALLICVGPATRLNPYLSLDGKRYAFRVSFGASTDTDDAEGRIIRQSSVPADIHDPAYATLHVADMKGPQQQIPPIFSAIKVGGRRSYKAAREGAPLELKPRGVEVFEASLLGLGVSDEDTVFESARGKPFWDVEVHVSKGTYIRSLARDLGERLGVPAHVSMLRRLTLGSLDVRDCLTLEDISAQREGIFLDPLVLLGFRTVVLDASVALDVASGKPLSPQGLAVFNPCLPEVHKKNFSSPLHMEESDKALQTGETVSLVYKNTLQALYQFDEQSRLLKPHCVFSTGVSCGRDYSNRC